MRTLIDFSILQEYYEEVLPLGDKLSALSALVNWNAFLRTSNNLTIVFYIYKILYNKYY